MSVPDAQRGLSHSLPQLPVLLDYGHWLVQRCHSLSKQCAPESLISYFCLFGQSGPATAFCALMFKPLERVGSIGRGKAIGCVQIFYVSEPKRRELPGSTCSYSGAQTCGCHPSKRSTTSIAHASPAFSYYFTPLDSSAAIFDEKYTELSRTDNTENGTPATIYFHVVIAGIVQCLSQDRISLRAKSRRTMQHCLNQGSTRSETPFQT